MPRTGSTAFADGGDVKKKTQPVTKQQEARARAIVQRAMNQAKAREVEAQRRLIGRCFRYPNRYSDSESWWLYAVVTGVDEYGRLSVTQFQHTSTGQIEIRRDSYPGLLPVGGWEAITVEQFKAASYELMSAFCQALGSAVKVGAVDPVGGKSTS